MNREERDLELMRVMREHLEADRADSLAEAQRLLDETTNELHRETYREWVDQWRNWKFSWET